MTDIEDVAGDSLSTNARHFVLFICCFLFSGFVS
jgi:hypothetical protein